MAVIISNIDMPNSCDYCKFSNYHDGDDYCELFKILNGCSWRTKDVMWNEDCPLKEMNMQNINEELRQKFKRMSPEQFEKYIHELQRMYMKEHRRLFFTHETDPFV